MTKKKRELIDLMFDAGITPETWPKKAVYAAQDKDTLTWGKNALMFYTDYKVPHVNEGRNSFEGEKIGNQIELPELCRKWNKTIVHRDEFMKLWNERNAQNDNKPTLIGRITWNGKFIFEDFTETNTTTPPAQQEANTEETKPIQQEVKASDTQIGGNHYTKLAIQPMRYSMENGLDALQHTVIKYVTRFRDKNGIEDLEKAKHCIDMLIEFERNKS